MDVAKKHAERLPELRKFVMETYEGNRDNVLRYQKFMRFVFKSSLTDDEDAALASNGVPTLQFNIVEAYVSRERGEFINQEPSVEVSIADTVQPNMVNDELVNLCDVIEANFRATLSDATNDMLPWHIHTEQLGGGFSVMRVYTEYANAKSNQQVIKIGRVYDPTLTGFDELARDSHKGDGRFCYELYPMIKDEVARKWGDEVANEMKYTRNVSEFSWSFQNESQKIALICDFYEKQYKKTTLYELSNGSCVTKDEYAALLKSYEEQGLIEQPPIPVSQRPTEIEHIVRYIFCENKVLECTNTDFPYLPLVYVDGNSVVVNENGKYSQVSRPYAYNAEGIQRLKNYAGQSLANELENTVQHKFIAAVEGIPMKYQSAYQNVQKSDVLLFNHFLDTRNPEVTIPPPREVARTPIPPEISNTFRMSDEMTQAILGAYDPAQGMNKAPMSGVAFARSRMQSNSASMPYKMGYIMALNRVAQIYVALLPKYYKKARNLPLLMKNGERTHLPINQQGTVNLKYDPSSLQIKVEAGVNFAMQKEMALQTVISLCQANQGFAEFFNDVGLPMILDNIEMRGIDYLKEQFPKWQQGKQRQQAMAQQMQQQAMQMEQKKQVLEMAQMQKQAQAPSEQEIQVMAIQEKARNDAANLQLKQRDSDSKFLDIMSKIRANDVDAQLKASEVDAENARTAVDSMLAVSKHVHEVRNAEAETQRQI